MNKMFVVDVRLGAPWASSPAYVRAGSRPTAIKVYMDNLTGIGSEGDLNDDDIVAVSFPACPINHSTLVDEKVFPGMDLLVAAGGAGWR